MKATGVTVGLAESKRQPTAGYMALFTSCHLQADCLYTWISSGPNALGNEYGKTLPFLLWCLHYYVERVSYTHSALFSAAAVEETLLISENKF